MRRFLTRLGIVVALLAACLPAAFIVTFMLLPLWSWIEATYGIESVGHSGPADWCFDLIYGILALGSVAGALLIFRKSGSAERSAEG